METNFPTQQQFDGFMRFLSNLVSLLPKIALMAILIVIGAICLHLVFTLAFHLMNVYRLLKRKAVLLELTPQAFAEIEMMATQGLFSELHGLDDVRPYSDKLLYRKTTFSSEIVSTRDGGIRYLMRVAASDRESFEREIAGYDTTIQTQEVEDYLPGREKLRRALILEFRQTHGFVQPLKKHTMLDISDPATYMTNAMTKLKPGELIALQIVLTPTYIRDADKVAGKIVHNEEQIHNIGRRHLPIVKPVLFGISKALFAVTGAVGDVTHGPSVYAVQSRHTEMQHYRQVSKRIKPARTLGHIEQQLAQNAYDKVGDKQYRASIRVLILTDDKQRMIDRAKGIRKAFGVYDAPKYQKLRARFNFPYAIRRPYRQFMFRSRLPELFNKRGSVLSAAEVGSIYHFPHSGTGQVDGVKRSLSVILPAPPIIKKRADNHEFDVVLGRNIHHGEVTDIGMLAKEREKHLYIIGGTGNGKTTFMEYCFVQDIRNGKGGAYIDAHGDSAKKILRYIPKERVKDIVYLNPIDIKYPPGLNLLELPTGLDEDELLLEKGRVTSAVVSVMRKVFSDDEANAHRIEAIMRNAVHTALTVEGATLFTVLKLLRNEKFRKDVVSRLDDEDLKDFWREEIGQAGDMQMVSMTKGVTQRIDRFNISAPAKRMLSQSKSTINFEDIMDSGKILICNLGDLEEDETSLFGTTILAKLKMAAERRARMPEEERRPFYVYADEFQNFATKPFVKMLSSSRKYKFFLTIAEQSTKQQEDDRLTEGILSNVSTAVCFRTGSYDDEVLMLHRFEPFLKEGDISNLPTYNFYVRIQAQDSIEPMSGQTIVLSPEEASEEVAAAVIKASQETYAPAYVKPASEEPKKKRGGVGPDDKGGRDGKQQSDNKDSNDPAQADDDS